MTNRELAASLSENALGLIKEILIRHECAILGGAKQILAMPCAKNAKPVRCCARAATTPRQVPAPI